MFIFLSVLLHLNCISLNRLQGIAQPAYLGNNWFTQPVLPSNLSWAQGTALDQYKQNQISYQEKGWQLYPNGGYNTQREQNSPEIDDWQKGQPDPDWSPLAGGVGWGKKKVPEVHENVNPGEINCRYLSSSRGTNPVSSFTRYA